MFINVYNIIFVSSRADDKYHGYQSLAGICCQVRSQLASCKQPAIIALGRLPPADQVTETALMAFRNLSEMFALALVSVHLLIAQIIQIFTLESAEITLLCNYPAGKYVSL